jgi:metal-responsive CopG/Arc/MetJ family transcriptional regulator
MLTNKTVLKLNKFLCQRARKAAEKQGYSSLEEFIEHAIEKEIAATEHSDSKEDIANRLKGLGYIE